jgi:alpha-glucosidase
VDVDGRDPERAPMPWSPPTRDRQAAGFGEGEPWLPVHPDAERLAVAAQAGDPDAPLELYRALIALRRAEPALHEGSYRSLDAAPDVFAFVREHDGRRLLVALNFAPFPRPLPAEAADGRLLLSTHRELAGPELRPDEGRVIGVAGT